MATPAEKNTMTLVHWPECTNAPCTCGTRGDLLWSTNASPRVLLRDDAGQPIAVACTDCGKLTLDTVTGLCAHCRGAQVQYLAYLLSPLMDPRA